MDKVQVFWGIFELNEAEITDTLSIDDEMPRMSVAIWYLNRVGFDGTFIAEYHITQPTMPNEDRLFDRG